MSDWKATIVSKRPGRAGTLLPSPGARLVAALCGVAAVAISPGGSLLRYAAFGALFLGLIVIFRLRPIPLLRRFILLVPLLLVLGLAAILAGDRSGDPGGPPAAAFDLAVKTFLCFVAAAVTTGTLGPIRLLQGFQELRVPSTAAVVLSSGMRFLTLLGEEGTRMKRAREARLTRPEGLRRRLAFARGLVPRLFERAFIRSERTYAAMLSRGFDGRLRMLSRPIAADRTELGTGATERPSPGDRRSPEDLDFARLQASGPDSDRFAGDSLRHGVGGRDRPDEGVRDKRSGDAGLGDREEAAGAADTTARELKQTIVNLVHLAAYFILLAAIAVMP